MTRRISLKTASPAQTRILGRRLGRYLPDGGVVLLEGELGSGKTTMAKGIAASQGVPEKEVTSPTFVVINQYDGSRRRVYHIDWYRLTKVAGADLDLAGECFSDAEAVTLVEWPARGRAALPREYLRVRIRHEGGSKRLIQVDGRGKSFEDWARAFERGRAGR